MNVLDKELEIMISSISSSEGMEVFRLLYKKRDVSEFKIAEKLKLTINQVRNILYKFDKYNLISSIRKKDKKKGWYVYYWTFEVSKAIDAIKQFKIKTLETLKNRLENEKNNNFFTCHKKCVRLTFETAMENQFQCLECGQIMNPEDNTKLINKIKKEIEQLEIDVVEIEKLRPQPKIPKEEKKKPKKKVIKKKVKKKIKKITKKKVKNKKFKKKIVKKPKPKKKIKKKRK